MDFRSFSHIEAIEYTQYKHLYVDICGDDLVSGILLSKIVYWFGTSKINGRERCKHTHKDRRCLVKRRSDWWDECRISEKQYDRAKSVLEKLEFITVETHKSPFHNGETASFIFMNEDKFMDAVNAYLKVEIPKDSEPEGENPELPKGEFQSLPLGNSGVDQKVSPYTSTITTPKEKQQQAAAVFSKPAKKEQASPSARISPLLADVSIPQVDKAYLSEKYDDATIAEALAWSKHPDTKPIKELAAALKWACENKIKPPKDKVPEKSKVDVSPYNRSYWREIHKTLVTCGYRLPIVDMPEYLEIPNGKIYFKDVSFLEQIENFLRKNIQDLKVLKFVKSCQQDIKAHI